MKRNWRQHSSSWAGVWRGAWRTVGVTIVLVLALLTPAMAHEHGVVTLSAKSLPAHGALVIRAEKLTKNSSFRVELRGALQTYSFGRVRSDTAGRFELSTVLPADAGRGSYAVAVVASDGDVSARADLAITAAPVASASGGAMPGMTSLAGMPNMPHATAEYMSIPSTTTPAEWIVIAVAIAGSALAGTLLFRAPSPRTR